MFPEHCDEQMQNFLFQLSQCIFRRAKSPQQSTILSSDSKELPKVYSAEWIDKMCYWPKKQDWCCELDTNFSGVIALEFGLASTIALLTHFKPQHLSHQLSFKLGVCYFMTMLGEKSKPKKWPFIIKFYFDFQGFLF